MSISAREPKKKYRDRKYARVDKAKLTLIKDDKTAYSLILKTGEGNKLFSRMSRGEANPAKISFGVITKDNNRLEFCAYKGKLMPNPHVETETKDLSKPIAYTSPNYFLLFLNGEYISLDLDDWKRLYRISNRIGNYFGLIGFKRQKKRDYNIRDC